MPRLTFVSPRGDRQVISAAAGTTVMMAALVHDIDGLLAECGGALACGTCHVYVAPAQLAWMEPPGEDELAMLEMTASKRLPNSRLACQLRIGDALDGLVLELPPTQV